jgi:hypothetical protein
MWQQDQPESSAVSEQESLAKGIREEEFIKLMTTVSDGWNEGNARKSADCFTEDAVYMEPPNRQVYVGRKAIYEFFGGPSKPDPPMRMIWHHLSFNEQEQAGFGEYTFQMNFRYHGIVTVAIQNGKIAKWREYQYQSPSDWDTFVGKSRF